MPSASLLSSFIRPALLALLAAVCLVCAPTSASAQTPTPSPAAGGGVQNAGRFAELEGSNVFSTLPDLATKGRQIFTAFAFVMVLAGVVNTVYRAESYKAMLQPVLAAALVAGCIHAIPYLMNLGLTIADDAAVATGTGSATVVANKVTAMADLFIDPEKSQAQAPAGTTATANAVNKDDTTFLGGIGAYFSNRWANVKSAAKLMNGGVMDSAAALIHTLFIMVIHGICFALLYIAGAATHLVMTFRYFVVIASSILMPVAIAGLLIQSWRGNAMSFIMSIIGVMSWPIGYAVGHLGTLAIFTWCIHSVEMVYGLANNSLVPYIDPTSSHSFVDGAATLATGAAKQVFLGPVTVLMGISVLTAWILAVDFGAAFGMSKFVMGGANFFGALTAGATKTAAGEGGRTLSAGSLMLGSALGGSGKKSKKSGSEEGGEEDGKNSKSGKPSLGSRIGGLLGGGGNGLQALSGAAGGADRAGASSAGTGGSSAGAGGAQGGGAAGMSRTQRSQHAARSAYAAALGQGASQDSAMAAGYAAGGAVAEGKSSQEAGAAASQAASAAGASPAACSAAGQGASEAADNKPLTFAGADNLKSAGASGFGDSPAGADSGTGGGGGGGGGAASRSGGEGSAGKSGGKGGEKSGGGAGRKLASVIPRLGFAAGETLAHMGDRFNGDPSTLSGAITTGFGSKRNYDQQENQRASAQNTALTADNAALTAENSQRTAAGVEQMAASMQELTASFGGGGGGASKPSGGGSSGSARQSTIRRMNMRRQKR